MKTTPGKLNKLAEDQNVSVRELIIAAIKARGSVQAAATYLGVTPNTIYHHIKRLNITINRKTLVEGNNHD